MRIFATVLIKATGMEVPAGTGVPAKEPVEVFANWVAATNADARFEESPADDPISEGDAANGARAVVAATVVTSFRTI